MEKALRLAQRCYLLETGRIAAQGTPEELGGKAGVRKLYLG